MSELLEQGKVANLIKKISEAETKRQELSKLITQYNKEAYEAAADSQAGQLAYAMHNRFCERGNGCEWYEEEGKENYSMRTFENYNVYKIWENGSEHKEYLSQAEGVLKMQPYTEAMNKLR